MAALYQIASMTLACLFLVSPIIMRLKYRWIACVLFIVLICIIPFRHLTVVNYLSGYFSTLSVTSIVLMSIYLMRLFNIKESSVLKKNKNVLMIIMSITFIFLYPLSLFDITAFYPYGLGYNAVIIPAFYLLLSLIAVCYCLEYAYLFLFIAFICLLYFFRIPNGDNFWNYLIDPFVGIYACFVLVIGDY